MMEENDISNVDGTVQGHIHVLLIPRDFVYDMHERVEENEIGHIEYVGVEIIIFVMSIWPSLFGRMEVLVHHFFFFVFGK